MSVVTLAQNIRNLKATVGSIKESTQSNITDISQQVQFSAQDNKEFNDLLNDIKQETLRKVVHFYQLKVHDKTKFFQSELNTCEQDYGETLNSILEQQELIKQKTEYNIQKKQKYDVQILQMVMAAERIRLRRRTFNFLKEYAASRRVKQQKNKGARERYRNGLQSKVFYIWRGMSHKNGYQTMLINQAAKDIKNIQSQFVDIVKVLKGKIAETEEQIQIKRNAKAEFSYSLSRNLLKTISNLSMEVMSLHQVTVKDGQLNNDENTKFLREVNQIVASKLNNIQQLRDKLKVDETAKKVKVGIQFDLQNHRPTK